jgi:hypothetical protein
MLFNNCHRRALLIEGMIFSEKGRTAPFLRKNHPWILQPPSENSEPTICRILTALITFICGNGFGIVDRAYRSYDVSSLKLG